MVRRVFNFSAGPAALPEPVLAQAAAEMDRRNTEKAALLYGFIDGSGGFFTNPVRPQDRSRMNVPFSLRDNSHDELFLKGAEERDLVQLKGHRTVGGMRASLYNAMPLEGVRRLVGYMRDFAARYG